MKKSTLLIIAASAILFFDACQSAPTTPTEQPEVVKINISPNDSLFVVDQGGYQFAIALPKDLMINDAPRIEHQSSSGELHIKIGDNFWLVAIEGQSSLDQVKSELGEDMLFTFKVVEEDKSTMVYQRFLPDGTEYDYSFRSMNQVGQKYYMFKACDEGEFTKEEVGKMRHSVSSVQQAV
jgi:hypothetical protein